LKLHLRSEANAMTELTVTLPDELARKAKEAGILNAEGIERALRDALKREAGRKLLEIGKSMREANLPPMSEEEVQAEIDAVRAARRAKRDATGA
jgi:post-segregation antitoxin (ccd killing protein)